MKKVGVLLSVLGWGLIPVMIIMGLNSSISFTPLLLIVSLVCIFSGVFISLRHGRKVKQGPLVIGTITSVQPTGMYVNNQPQVKFSVRFATQTGEQVTATDMKVLPMVNVAQFQPGVQVPIRYDPTNPQDIMIDFKADQRTIQQAADATNIASGQVTQEAVYIRDNGVKATGLILASKPTGNIVHGLGELELQVKVTRPDGSTYEVTVNKAVPHAGLSFAQPGSVVHVIYMPQDEQNIVIGFCA